MSTIREEHRYCHLRLEDTERIKAGADIECRDKDGDTPISCASIEGQKEVVDLLIEASANIESSNQKNKSPVVCAAEEGNVEVVEVLLKKGARTESASYGSILNIAATFGHRRIVESLLKRGLSLESRDLKGNTPLQNATIRGHISVVQLLIKSGANTSTFNSSSESIIYSAASSGHADIVKYFGKRDTKTFLNSPNASGWTPILKAVSDGHFQTVRQLHSLGADMNCTVDGKGLLHFAAESGCQELYQYLIIAGLDGKRPNSHGLKSYECFPFHSIIKYTACNRLGHSTEQSLNETMTKLNDPNVTYKFKYKLSALSSEPGQGKVACIEGKVSETIVRFVREKDVIRGLKLCGSSAEGTKVQLPDEMDFLRLLDPDHLTRNEVVDTLHGYKYIKSNMLKERFYSSKTIHVLASQSVESEAKAKESEKSGEIFSQGVAGGGSASVPVTIRWHENESSSLLVSVDIVPILHVDDWPDDAIKKTWLMDEDTLRKGGYRLVAKPPHKGSEYGRSLPEEEREKMWRISFSHLEPATIAPLDPTVKDAYITAKCLRSPMACGIVIKDTDGVIHFVSHFLTSYLLKIVFLHNIDDFLETNRSLPEMVCIIYSQLEEYLGKGNLPFYWQPSVNLLEGLKLNIAKSHQVAKLMKAIAGRMYRLECDGGNHGDDAREDGLGMDAADDKPGIGCYIVRLE